MIVVVVVCLVAAGFIMFKQFSGGSSGPDSYTLKCTSCGAVFEMTPEEMQEQMAEQPMMNPMSMAAPKYKCKECGKETAYVAEKCEKCGEVFFPNYNAPDGIYDRCPKCGYSAIEEAKKNK